MLKIIIIGINTSNSPIFRKNFQKRILFDFWRFSNFESVLHFPKIDSENRYFYHIDLRSSRNYRDAGICNFQKKNKV